MPSVCRGDDGPFVSRKIVKSLQELKNEVIQNNGLSEASLEQFKQTSILLSSRLLQVSDSTLLQIDDLLYKNYYLTLTNLSNISTEKTLFWQRYHLESCLHLYSKIYMCIVTKMSVVDQTFDTTLLQLIEHPRAKLIRSKYGCRELLLCAYQLAKTRCYKKICQALKFLKIVLGGDGKVMKQYLNLEDTHLALYLKNLMNVPEARHPEKKRISLWIASQASDLFGDLNVMSLRLNPSTQKYLAAYRPEKNKTFDGAYIQSLLDSLGSERQYGMSFHFDHLHNYFVSGQDKDQRIKLLENFFRTRLSKDKQFDNPAETSKLGLLIRRCDNVVRHFFYFIDHLLNNDHYSKDLLNEIDEYYDYRFEPYLSNHVTSFVHTTSPLYMPEINMNDEAKESKVERMNEHRFSDHEKEYSTDEDYAIEKFLVYDKFMRSLEVMTILYDACLMCCEIIKLEGGIEIFAGKMFRKKNTPFKQHMNRALLDPSTRGKMPWWLLKAVKKCPFLFVSRGQEAMLDDLIKMLEGEEVNEETEEKLYFTINSGGVTDVSLNHYRSY